jgi:hypothetical protein
MPNLSDNSEKAAKALYRNIKIALIVGLSLLSWIATYTGMIELIKANSGDVSLGAHIAIGFAVAMLMLMILYLLDALFSPISKWLRLLYMAGYLFLTLISVGFGFGFYWKYIEARSEATRSAEAAITQVQSGLQYGQSRLEQLQQTLVSLTAISTRKAADERANGNTCPNSKPGVGPRMRLRDADAQKFGFAGQYIGTRIGSVNTDISALNSDLKRVLNGDKTTIDPKTGTRNAFLRKLNRKINLTISRFNSLRTDPQLREFRDIFRARAAKSVFSNDKGGTFNCPDPQLQAALRGVVRAIDGLPNIENPQIAAVEGSEAIIEAFRRLTNTSFGLISLQMPPSADELRKLQRQAVQQATSSRSGQVVTNVNNAGLGERDYIPLFVAIFVDFCILLVSVNRPINHFESLAEHMQSAEPGPMRSMMSRIYGKHQSGLNREFEVFQHIVFDFWGHYFAAVPLDMQDTEARYLANLFVGLEGKGIVRRSLFVPASIVKNKMREQNSKFADRKFRLYRFSDNALSKMVLDAMMGVVEHYPDVPEDSAPELMQPKIVASEYTAAERSTSAQPVYSEQPAPETGEIIQSDHTQVSDNNNIPSRSNNAPPDLKADKSSNLQERVARLDDKQTGDIISGSDIAIAVSPDAELAPTTRPKNKTPQETTVSSNKEEANGRLTDILHNIHPVGTDQDSQIHYSGQRADNSASLPHFGVINAGERENIPELNPINDKDETKH